ncbi:MAG: MCE family protein, partial [Planctomycetaceae bacterium]|nr:MCE family protein [Planctomycetaceae bacterium]
NAVVVMVFRFGELGNYWKAGTRLTVVMPDGSGIHPETPVRMSGIRIGQVESVALVAEGRGVAVRIALYSGYSFRSDSAAVVTRSLLGDAAIEIVPGRSGEPIAENARIPGRSSANPSEVIARVEQQLTSTLDSFETTGREWGRLAENLNQMLETSGPDGVSTMQRSAVALEQFTRTMKAAEQTLAAAGSLISDPEYQQQLQRTLAALPELLNETRTTLTTVNTVAGHLQTTVMNLNTATTPLARHSAEMTGRLSTSLANIEVLTAELAQLSGMANQQNGTVKQLLTDPAVYRNLNSATGSLAVLLENLRPVIADLQVFSDKVARHPEVLGVRGAVRGSTGTKTSDVQPASFER